MNYKKIYDELIKSAQARRLDESQRKEKHHIIPVCRGGNLKDINNIVELTPREHYVAHKLLHYAYPEDKGLQSAYCMMAFSTIKKMKIYDKGYSTSRFYKVTSREYEYCRELASNILKQYKGYKYVTNEEINKLVPVDEIQEWLDKGFRLGKKHLEGEALESLRRACRERVLSDETRRRKANSIARERNPSFGTKMMNNGTINRRIKKEEVQEYLNKGWKLGQIYKNGYKFDGRKDANKRVNLGRIFVHNIETPYKYRAADKENLDYYLNVLGWKLGIGQHKEEAKTNNNDGGYFMHWTDPFKKKKVKPELVDLYLQRGWKLGHGKYLKQK